MTRTYLIAATICGALALPNGPALSAPKHCPPGHAKKGWCSPGKYNLPPGIRYKVVDRWHDHGLRRPGPGEAYIIVDNEVLLVIEATLEVLEAIGAVSRVLN